MPAISSFVIVGGGTAGWIAAAILANQYRQQNVAITLVESAQIGTIGVGESTIPPFLELLQQLNINEQEFIRYTQASFKLGIEFQDWRVKGESYFHPFGAVKGGMDEFTFYQTWLKHREQLTDLTFDALSLNTAMAGEQRFCLPQPGNSPLNDVRYALHLDATKVAAYLQQYAMNLGVRRIEGNVLGVSRQDDRISTLLLESGEEIRGDFFIDCTGFTGLLIEKTLGEPLEDWSDYLPNDRAIVVQTQGAERIAPRTLARAMPAGWMWQISLQNRQGNGYVYSSRFIDDEQAKTQFCQQLDGEPLGEPRVLRFRTGMRQRAWVGNCLSVGLAGGFIEPLESTAIHLIIRSMVHFMRHLPDNGDSAVLQRETNRRIRMDFEEIRDFIVLHYCLTERDDTPYWQWCKSMPMPDSLRYTLDYFKQTGSLPEVVDPLFSPVSWRAVCEGMGFVPQRWSPLIDHAPAFDATGYIRRYHQQLQQLTQALPMHSAFIRDNCAAEPSTVTAS